MELDAVAARRAVEEALQTYPRFEAFGPRLVARPLFEGHALLLEYAVPPPREDTDAWEFQNAAVKAYKRIAAAL